MPPKKAEPAVLLQKGDTGDRVRELQHRLFQLDWFPGPITGSYRAATVEAVSGFQQRRDIEVSGAVDQKTWNALVKRTQQPTRDQLYNILRPGPAILSRGSQGDQVRELQSRLKQIGWHTGKITDFYGAATVSNVRGFQARRAIPVTGEVDQRTWDRLTAMTREPTRNEKHNVLPRPSVAGLDSRCMTGRAMCVSKSTNQLVWVIDGQPQLRVDVRFGSQELPTREGAFSVGWKSRDHVSTLYHTPMPFAMFFSGGQAVHYSPDFAARGYAGASHGCVNVRDRQAIEHLFDTVRVGDKVIVHR
ncbi:MAG TPA: peptidoglycan-binding protein [Propionibacteriaceae bacterium]|nr:peptidoglycan-binding protein [Propionibacteriaceae bacterium]